MNMETYRGQVKTPNDAIILFEACRLGNLPRVQRRLSEKERQMIKSGSVFVWDEREAGMKRWTDGKSWSASRVAGSFLTYREMEGKRGGSAFNSPATGTGMGHTHDAMDTSGDGPDGYRYKPDGLMKQSFSITTAAGQHLHLISYWARALPTGVQLPTPSTDPSLRHIRPEKGMYPEATVNESQNMPAVTRSPMDISPYGSSPSHPHAPTYLRHAPPQIQGGYGWSPNSMRSPTSHYSPYQSNYYQTNGHPASNGPSPLHHQQSTFPSHSQMSSSSLTAFDRAPPPMRGTGIPPPPERGPAPPPAPAQPYPQHQPPYSHQPSTSATYSPHLAPDSSPSPRAFRPPEASPPQRLNGHLGAPRSPYLGRTIPGQDSHYPMQNGVSPKLSQVRYEDSQRPSHMRSMSDRSATSGAPERGKTIPSITSLINKSPSPPHRSQIHTIAPSIQSPGIRATTTDSATAYGNGSRPPQGDAQLKDIPTGKGFGEDHRALRKLDKAFAM